MCEFGQFDDAPVLGRPRDPTVFIMKSLEIEVAISHCTMVDRVPVCESREERPGKLCQWMEP
jgi:hypothetical protein